MTSDKALPEDARRALRAALARPLSYDARALVAPRRLGEPARVLVLLGEAHMKLPRAERLGNAVVDAFALRGVEGLDFKRVLLGRLMWVFVRVPRIALRVATLGFVKGSTIHYAMKREDGDTVRLEEMFPVPFGVHVASVYCGIGMILSVLSTFFPALYVVMSLYTAHFSFTVIPAFLLRRKRWAFMINPFFGILAPRDKTMADGLAMMMEEHDEPRSALAIMGRAHLPGCSKILTDYHGYEAVDVHSLIGTAPDASTPTP